jgi:hypothetical protein
MEMMAASLDFTVIHTYDAFQPGITVPIEITSSTSSVRFEAKIDTGSSCCIFRRLYGEKLGFEIEKGSPQWIGTAMGKFLTYGHEATISVFGIETLATIYFAKDQDFTHNVLGRQGWLDRVRLGLVDYESNLYLNAYHDAE